MATTNLPHATSTQAGTHRARRAALDWVILAGLLGAAANYTVAQFLEGTIIPPALAYSVLYALIAGIVAAGWRWSVLVPLVLFGVRFFGIGNELEAAVGAMLLLAVGAAVTALGPRDPRRAVAIAVAAVTVVAVLAFAPGRFGADVGAAITFPAGAAATIVVALRLGARKAALVIAAPIVALAALVLFDIVIPGDSHLTRSVLAAGGLDDLGDVFDRRITLAARSFPRYLGSPFFIAALAAIAIAIVFRRQVISWFAGRPAALAGTAGAVTATIVGTLANDSAALLLMIGTGYVAAYCGLTWGSRRAQRPASDRDSG